MYAFQKLSIILTDSMQFSQEIVSLSKSIADEFLYFHQLVSFVLIL